MLRHLTMTMATIDTTHSKNRLAKWALWELVALQAARVNPSTSTHAEKALQHASKHLTPAEIATFAALEGWLKGETTTDNLLESLARAASEDVPRGGASKFREILCELLKPFVASLVEGGKADEAEKLFERIDSAAGGHVKEIQALQLDFESRIGAGAITLAKRQKAEKFLLGKFRANPMDWAAAHSLAVLYWHWATSEEMKPRNGITVPQPGITLQILCPHCRTVLRIPGEDISKKWECPECKSAFSLKDPGTAAPNGVLVRAHDGCLCMKCSKCGAITRASNTYTDEACWNCACGNSLHLTDYLDVDRLWTRAVGFWAYILGQHWVQFSQWFVAWRNQSCGLTPTDEQVSAIKAALLAKIAEGFRSLTDFHQGAGRKADVARIRLADIQLQVEQKVAKLVEKEVLPYARRRAESGLASLTQKTKKLLIAGPTVIKLLGLEAVLVSVLEEIDANPPTSRASEPSADDLLSLLLQVGAQGGNPLDSSALRLLRGASTPRLLRQHQAILDCGEEIMVHHTPLGPMLMMANEGSPQDVLMLKGMLPGQLQTSALARYVEGLAYRRAGDLAAGQGGVAVKEAVAQWRLALKCWKDCPSPGTQDFLSRRLPGMLRQAAAQLTAEASRQIMGACEPAMTAARHAFQDFPAKGGDSSALHPDMLDEPVQNLKLVAALLRDFDADTTAVLGQLTEVLQARAITYFRQACAAEDVDKAGAIKLFCHAKDDLLACADSYPSGMDGNVSERRKEASIVFSRMAGLSFALKDLDSTILSLRKASELAQDEETRKNFEKNLVVVLRNKAVECYNSGHKPEALNLLNEAQRIAPQNAEVARDIAYVRQHEPAGGLPTDVADMDQETLMRLLEDIRKGRRS